MVLALKVSDQEEEELLEPVLAGLALTEDSASLSAHPGVRPD